MRKQLLHNARGTSIYQVCAHCAASTGLMITLAFFSVEATSNTAAEKTVYAQEQSTSPPGNNLSPYFDTLRIPIIRRPAKPAEVDPDVAHGYQHALAGQLESARRDYESALRNDPKNVDALHGLAIISLRQNRNGDAKRYFKLALETDPTDPIALAATIDAWGASDPIAAEGRLKNLLAIQPGAASLSFSLGNLYARQRRWQEAQQAYFSAVAGDGDNPDYLFNLAVSLDHLGQPELAAQHYRLALTAAGRQPSGFSAEQVQLRLQKLSR